MIRPLRLGFPPSFLLILAAAALAVAPAALAETKPAKPAKADKKPADKKPAKHDAKSKPTEARDDKKGKGDGAGASGKPLQVGTFGDGWGAYTAGAGKARTCYALAKPKDRSPASLKRDPGYVFISDRPGESVKNEISFVMGFELKADGKASAEIGSASFDLVAKGSNLWIKNPAEEPQFVEAMRKGQKLVVKAQSKKGNQSVDNYVLSGAAQALDRAAKDCQ